MREDRVEAERKRQFIMELLLTESMISFLKEFSHKRSVIGMHPFMRREEGAE